MKDNTTSLSGGIQIHKQREEYCVSLCIIFVSKYIKHIHIYDMIFTDTQKRNTVFLCISHLYASILHIYMYMKFPDTQAERGILFLRVYIKVYQTHTCLWNFQIHKQRGATIRNFLHSIKNPVNTELQYSSLHTLAKPYSGRTCTRVERP